MALLTYEWRPPDTSAGVNAYLAGVRAGQDVGKQLLERRQMEQREQQAQQNMALQLLQEARLARADDLRAKAHAELVASRAPQAWTPLAAPTAGVPVGTVGPQPDMASSLVAAPGARTQTDLSGPDFEPGSGGIAQPIADPLAEIRAPMAPTGTPVSTGPLDPRPRVPLAPDLPAGRSGAPMDTHLFDVEASPAEMLLSPTAVARVNQAGGRYGSKAGQAQELYELKQAARQRPATPAPAGDEYTFDDASGLYRNAAGAQFKRNQGNNGRFSYTQVVTKDAPQQSEAFQRIGNFEKHGVFRVNPDDPGEVYMEKFTTKGQPYYSPVAPKVVHVGANAYLQSPDGDLQPIETKRDATVSTFAQKSYMDLKNKRSLYQTALEQAQRENDSDRITSSQNGLRMVTEQLGMLEAFNPRLSEVSGSGGSPFAPAGTPAPAAKPAGKTTWKLDPKTGTKWEVDEAGKLTGKYVPAS